MKVGVIYKPEVPNIHYRALGPAHAIARKGHEVLACPQGSDDSIRAEGLAECDVVHVYRRGDRVVSSLVDDLRQRGVAVTWDNDDDIRLLPEHTGLHARIGKLGTAQDFQAQRKMLRRVDLVTTTSDYLAGCYREVTEAPVVQIENYLDDSQYPRNARKHDGVVIGWVAHSEHRSDEQALKISDILRRVIDANPAVQVVTIGVKLDLPSDRYRHLGRMPFDELQAHVRQFDIGIAPVADIPMTYARSNIKVKEYAGAGIPWVASARGPYEGLGPREGGLLVADDGWEAALNQLASSSFQRLRLRRRAQAWGKAQHIDRHVDRWIGAFEQAIEAAGRRRADGGQRSRQPA